MDELHSGRHGSYAETPDLWKTREQPVAILKSGVNLFIDYLFSMDADDQVGLSVYSLGTSAGAKLELGLSKNLPQVKTSRSSAKRVITTRTLTSARG